MKYFLVLAFIAVAYANRPTALTDQMLQVQQLVDAINSPYTDPATAVALQSQLFQILGIEAPAPESISSGPEPVDLPIIAPSEPIVVAPSPVPAPVLPSPVPAPVASENSAPLVQIILNIEASSGAAPGFVASPIEIPSTHPEVVSVVNPIDAVNVVDSAPEAVNVVDFAPEAVNVVDVAPEAVNVVQPIPLPISLLPAIIQH